MLEKMKSVNNPLTIIGLFCGVAEVVSLFTIARIAPELQSTLLLFVIGFPVLIVLLFFGTLWFKDRVLYAPGDFKDEQNYLALVNAKHGLDKETIKLMISEAKTEITDEVLKTVSTASPVERHKIEEIVQDKLKPVQSFADKWRNDKYGFSSTLVGDLTTLIADYTTTEISILRLLSTESKPMTLEEIASALSLNEYFLSTILFSLIHKKQVRENPELGGRKTYSAIPLPDVLLIDNRSVVRKKHDKG